MREKARFILKRIKEGRLREMEMQIDWVYQYAKKYWLAMIFYTLLGMTGTVISLGSSLVSKDLVNIITGHKTGALVETFCMMIGLTIGSTIIHQIANYASSWISMKVDAEIKADVFSKILVTDWESLTEYHTGDLLTRWSSDASVISSGVLNFIPDIIMYSFEFLSAFAIILYYDYTFAIFSFIGMPVSLLMSKRLMRRMVNNNKRSAQMGAKMSGFNQEAFSNIQTIKAFDMIRLYIERLKQLQKEYISMKLEFQRASMFTSLLMTIIGLGVSYAAYGWGIYRVWSGKIDYGTMTMFLALSGQLTGNLNSLTSLVPSAISITTSAGRIMDVIEMPQEDYSDSDNVSEFLEKNKKIGISLEMDNITYGYKGGDNVFENAKLEAHPNEIVALVGPSGEGKTTMLRLILALIKPTEGKGKFWSGTTLNEDSQIIELSPAARKMFSYVPQGNTMFSGTIADNMRNVKVDATDEEIIRVLKIACAWEFVQKLPEGINSVIKERGGGFSEGQAQRLSIARALLRKSPILLMDEATSALDVATEKRVLKNIVMDKYPRTCIVTTHRPSVLAICNRVYSIEDKKCEVMKKAEIDKLINEF